jgi:hypothetical protein
MGVGAVVAAAKEEIEPRGEKADAPARIVPGCPRLHILRV